MIESQQVLEWMAMGEARGEARSERNALLLILEVRFPPGAPTQVLAVIRATNDLVQLRTWLQIASTAASLDAFRLAVSL